MQNSIRFLVVSRMTKYCQETVKYGISLARKYGAQLFVLHIFHNPLDFKKWDLPSECTATESPDAFVNAKASLDEILRDTRVGELHIKELIKEGDPVDEILKTIDDEKINFLVLRHPEESKLEHFLFGLINEELLRRKPCPILFVKK